MRLWLRFLVSWLRWRRRLIIFCMVRLWAPGLRRVCVLRGRLIVLGLVLLGSICLIGLILFCFLVVIVSLVLAARVVVRGPWFIHVVRRLRRRFGLRPERFISRLLTVCLYVVRVVVFIRRVTCVVGLRLMWCRVYVRMCVTWLRSFVWFS